MNIFCLFSFCETLTFDKYIVTIVVRTIFVIIPVHVYILSHSYFLWFDYGHNIDLASNKVISKFHHLVTLKIVRERKLSINEILTRMDL